MKILVLGGTRYFGIHMVEELIRKGHDVTIATRQIKKDNFGDVVKRIMVERTDPASMKQAFLGKMFDVGHRNLVWCTRSDFPYEEIKRQAECAFMLKAKPVQKH